MSTVAERKFVEFLRKLQTGGLDGNPLSFIQKIYSDTPQKNSSQDTFPRLKIEQIGSPSGNKLGFGSLTYNYNPILNVFIYVDMDEPFDESIVSAFWSEGRNLSPEEACGAIGDFIIQKVQKNYTTLQSDNSYKFILGSITPYNGLGIDNEFFKNTNVFKGVIGFQFIHQFTGT